MYCSLTKQQQVSLLLDEISPAHRGNGLYERPVFFFFFSYSLLIKVLATVKPFVSQKDRWLSPSRVRKL